jgi:glycosyltransferase involved in cell wall biosynthesis
MVHRLGIEARIHFLGVRSDVPELLKSADVVVMSSHHEGLSLSNLEGMAAGKPFVASDVDGLREIVAGYGVLFPHEDHNSLALEIKRLCEDTRYANNIASRCLLRAKEFDISSTVIGYSTIYRELINQKT